MAKPRAGLGTSIQDLMVPGAEEEPRPEPEPRAKAAPDRRRSKTAPSLPKTGPVAKTLVTHTPAAVKMTFRLPSDLAGQCRGAARDLSGKPEYLTLDRLAELALQAMLAKLAKRHNGGEPFRPPAEPLKRGRKPGG